MRTISTIAISLFLFTKSFADSEPANNSYSTADTIAINGNASGSVTYGTDVDDYYKIVTSADGNLQVSVTGSTSDFLYLNVFDNDGTTQLAASTNNGTTGVSVTVSGRAAGTYFIRVSQLTGGSNAYLLTDTFTAESIANDAEPNDSVSTGLNLSTNSTVHGHIGFKSNGGSLDGDDYYKIITATDGNLKFSILGTEQSYLYIYLYDNNGTTQLGAGSNVGSSGVSLSVDGLAAGTYYLRIAAHNAAYYNGYTLTDSLIEELPANDTEPNDTVTTAGSFPSNSSVSGHVGYRFNGGVRDPFDYWKITATVPGDINIHFTGTQVSYLYLTLYDSSGTNQVGSNSGIGSSNLDFTATAQSAGTYYLRIAAFNAPFYNGYTVTNSVATSVNPVAGNHDNFRLYPNPATERCTLYLENSTAQEATVEIADMSGKICSAVSLSLQNVNSIPLNLEGLAKGIYLVKVKMNEANLINKLAIGR